MVSRVLTKYQKRGTILDHGSRLGASLCASHLGGARVYMRTTYVHRACEIGGVVTEQFKGFWPSE